MTRLEGESRNAMARRLASEKLMFADAPIDRDDVNVDDNCEVTHVDDGAAWVKVWIRVEGVE